MKIMTFVMIGTEQEAHHGVMNFANAIDIGTKNEPIYYHGFTEIEVLEAEVNSFACGKKVETSPSLV